MLFSTAAPSILLPLRTTARLRRDPTTSAPPIRTAESMSESFAKAPSPTKTGPSDDPPDMRERESPGSLDAMHRFALT